MARSDNINYGNDSEPPVKQTGPGNFNAKSYVRLGLRGIFDVAAAVEKSRADDTDGTQESPFIKRLKTGLSAQWPGTACGQNATR